MWMVRGKDKHIWGWGRWIRALLKLYMWCLLASRWTWLYPLKTLQSASPLHHTWEYCKSARFSLFYLSLHLSVSLSLPLSLPLSPPHSFNLNKLPTEDLFFMVYFSLAHHRPLSPTHHEVSVLSPAKVLLLSNHYNICMEMCKESSCFWNAGYCCWWWFMDVVWYSWWIEKRVQGFILAEWKIRGREHDKESK